MAMAAGGWGCGGPCELCLSPLPASGLVFSLTRMSPVPERGPPGSCPQQHSLCEHVRFPWEKPTLSLETSQVGDRLLRRASPDPESLQAPVAACRRGPLLLRGKQHWNVPCGLLVSTCSAKENNYYGLGGGGQRTLDRLALDVRPSANEMGPIRFSPVWRSDLEKCLTRLLLLLLPYTEEAHCKRPFLLSFRGIIS